MIPSNGPRILEFNQTERITARLRDLVRNYPKGLGLVKEFLQNADDAGATRLVMIYDRRQHTGSFSDYPNMDVAMGPSLLFVNDQIFSEDDFNRIQQIGEGGKVREAARTGRFGQGFNTCYSVSDHPSLLTGDKVAWFDPHHRVFDDGANARAWPLADVDEYYPDWIKTFESVGWTKNTTSFSGTAFRLPLRSADDAEKSEILKEPFADTDFTAILNELHKIGAALLVFLRSVSHLEVREIDSDGNDHLRFRISTANFSVVDGHRKALRTLVDGHPKHLLERWIETKVDLPVASYDHLFSIYEVDGSQRDEPWAVVTGLFRGPDDLLLHNALEVLTHDEKAIPWAGAAVCRNKLKTDSKRGGLACFLPIPEQTKWPVWLHGWFDLSSNRRGITRDADVGETTRSRHLWNKSLMEYAIGKAWAILVQNLQGLPEDNHKPYEFWLHPPDKLDEVDSALVSGFYNAIAELSVVRGRDLEGHKWCRIDEIRDLPADWNERLSGPLLAEGWVLSHPSLPEFVRKEFLRIKKYHSPITSKYLRSELKQQDSDPDISCNLESAPRPMLRKREWVYTLAEFCADGEWNNLHRLPLALLSDGLLHTFTSCGKLFLANDDERTLLHSLPERFLDSDYQTAIKLNAPTQALNLVVFDLSGLLEFVPTLLSQANPTNAWFIRFFDYLTSCDETSVEKHKNALSELTIIPDQNGTYCQMGLIETPLIPGGSSKALRAALTELGIPILTAEHDLEAAIVRFSSKHSEFVWDLTADNIADNLKSHAEEACLNEEALDKKAVLEPILDFLSSSSWLIEGDVRLPLLRQIRILPTTCGQRVAAQDDAVYIPDFHPPKGFDGQYRLLITGPGKRWLNLFEALRVLRLNGVRFVKSVLLPAFSNATPDQCRDYLKWIRDDFRSVEQDLTEDGRKELRREIRNKHILPVEGGGLLPPKFVYRPDSKETIELLGEFAPVPDKEFFSTDKDLWFEFYLEFGLPRQPLARDLYLKIKALSDKADIEGVGNIKIQMRKLIDHVRDRWSDLATHPVEGTLSFAEAISKIAWLPAITDENIYAASNKWPDRFWRAKELIPNRLGHLAASKYPIFELTEFSTEMSDALGLITKLQLDDVIEHFNNVRALPFHDGNKYDPVHKAAEGFYRYLGLVDFEKVPHFSSCLDDLKNQLCILIAGKWRHPSQCFFESLPFETTWAVSLSGTNLNIADNLIYKGLNLLGVRQRPDLDDWIQMLFDLAEKYQGMPLTRIDLLQAHHAIHLLRTADPEWLLEQEVFIPLINGSLENARLSFYLDDHRLIDNYSGSGSLPIVENYEDAYEVAKRSGATSLRKALIERLKLKPIPSKDSRHSALAAKLESSVRSKQFYRCLQRIAYEEVTRDKRIDVDAQEFAYSDQLRLPQKMYIIISPLIKVETVIEVDGEERVIFDGEPNFYLENDIPRLWLKEGKQRRIKDETVRAICELCGLSDQLRLSRVLDADPDCMENVLDEEEVAPLPKILTFDLEYKTSVAEENDSDPANVNDHVPEEALEASFYGEEIEEDESTASELIEELEHSVSVNPLEPPIKPGHGSSNPWRTNSASESEQNGDSTGVTSQHLRPHGSSTPHSPSKPFPHGHVQPPSSTKSRTSVPDGPPINPGHGSSKQWDSPAKGPSDSSRQVRLRTYVHEKIQDDYDSGDADCRSRRLGNAGEEIVLEYEKKRKRSAKKMPINHEGYDIESQGRDGKRYIEVKSIDGPWGDRGVGVTRAQYEAALRLKNEWWLYIVEHVTDPTRKKVHTINNPFHIVTEFRFDSGWKGAKVDESGLSPVETKPKIGAHYEREPGEIIKIESTTQRGEFWRVSYYDVNGMLQRAMWDASWSRV